MKHEVTEKQVAEYLKQQAPKITRKLNSNKDVVIKRKPAGQLKLQSCDYESMD